MATTDPSKLRVMVDANILVAGTGWPRFPYEVLQHAVRGDFTLVLSSIIIEEAHRHIARLIPNAVGLFEVFLLESGYELVADPTLDEVAENAQLVRDLKDVPIALAAIHAHIDFLVTPCGHQPNRYSLLHPQVLSCK